MNYKEFISKKKKVPVLGGFEIQDHDLNPMLFDFQKHCVKKGLLAGRYAFFEECGLGKSLQQVEWGSQISQKYGVRVLFLAPLSVATQTIGIAEKMGIRLTKFDGLYSDDLQITNYDQIDNVDFSMFGGIVLDESSILKSVDGVTKEKLIAQTRHMQFRSCFTATPSPNDDMEICNHAEFLGYGTRAEILATYFVHDGGETSKWRLKGHAKKDFWRWVKTWAIVVTNPSDIGFDGSAFILPELTLTERVVSVPVKQGVLFNIVSVSAIGFNAELRETMELRMAAVSEILDQIGDEQCVIWIKQNVEGDYIRGMIPDVVEIRGSDSVEHKENALTDFINGKIQKLVSKKKICGYGMNLQNCHYAIDVSVDFSFEALYQAIRRFYRFGQTKPVTYWMIVTDTMGNVAESIRRKQKQFEELKQNLIEL